MNFPIESESFDETKVQLLLVICGSCVYIEKWPINRSEIDAKCDDK